MQRPIKTLCELIPQKKLKAIAEDMGCCDWEKEILLELYSEPKKKTVESLEYSTKDNYLKRVAELEKRLVSYLSYGDILDDKYYKVMFFFLISNRKKA